MGWPDYLRMVLGWSSNTNISSSSLPTGGFVDYFRMDMGWWSIGAEPIISRHPFYSVEFSYYTPGSVESASI